MLDTWSREGRRGEFGQSPDPATPPSRAEPPRRRGASIQGDACGTAWCVVALQGEVHVARQLKSAAVIAAGWQQVESVDARYVFIVMRILQPFLDRPYPIQADLLVVHHQAPAAYRHRSRPAGCRSSTRWPSRPGAG